MKNESKVNEEAATLIFKQAKLVALELARFEVIIDQAIGSVIIAMAAMEKCNDAKTAMIAKETLEFSRWAAAEMLKVTKKEAEDTVRLVSKLAAKL